MAKKESNRKFKQARDIIYHAILDAWVIKNGGIEEELPRMKRAEAEKVRYHRIYCEGLLCAPGDGWIVIQP